VLQILMGRMPILSHNQQCLKETGITDTKQLLGFILPSSTNPPRDFWRKGHWSIYASSPVPALHPLFLFPMHTFITAASVDGHSTEAKESNQFFIFFMWLIIKYLTRTHIHTLYLPTKLLKFFSKITNANFLHKIKSYEQSFLHFWFSW